MGGTYSTNVKDENFMKIIIHRISEGNIHLGDLYADESRRIILKWI
jgi:hypothetical protein